MDQFLRLLTLQDPNTRVVLLGTTVLGVAAAVIGAFAMLRRRSLVGDAVAHAALPGICVAYLVIGDRNFAAFLLGATVAGVLAAAFVSLVRRASRIKEDAAIAMAIGGFFGLGIVLSRIIQNQPSGNRAGLDGFIFGKAASMVGSDATVILLAAGAILGAVGILYKELRLLCFDAEFAAGQGWPTMTLDLGLMALVCVCTVVGLPAVGVVLMVALLVVPPVAARFWTNRLGGLLLVAGAIGGFSGLAGTALSATVPTPAGSLSRGWPTGPMIVLVAAATFVISLLAAPRRGLVADLLRRSGLRRRVADQNLLRDVYESLEAASAFDRAWRPEIVVRDGARGGAVLRRAMRRGLVARSAEGFVLTPEGQFAAARMVRAHRLWELYLIEQADIAADHVDRDADQLEHVLPPQVLAQLEERLAREGRLPVGTPQAAAVVPDSPHPIPRRPPVSADRSLRSWPWILLLAVGMTHLAAQPAEAGPWDVASIVAPAESAPPLAAPPIAAIPIAAVPLADVRASAGDSTWFTVGTYEVRTDDLWTAATAVVCSVACGLVGCFLVLRRMSLLGDAISHAILPGLALAFILTGTREPLAMLGGALVVGVATALLSAGLNRWGKVPEDAAMGVVFTSLFALGVILITLVARNVDLDPGCVLYGLLEFVPFDTTTIGGVAVPRAFLWLGLVLLLNAALIVVFFKELRIVCFDPALATTMGISAVAVHYGLMAAVAGTAVASFESVGSILVIAMLVSPGATAHLLTDRLSRLLWWSVAIATLSALLGQALAVWLDTSIAGMIATVSLGLFVLTLLGAPRHGVLVRVLRRRGAMGRPLTDPEASPGPPRG